MSLLVRRVKIYHLQVVVKRGEDGLAGDAGWEGGDGGEDGADHRVRGGGGGCVVGCAGAVKVAAIGDRREKWEVGGGRITLCLSRTHSSGDETSLSLILSLFVVVVVARVRVCEC